MVRTKFYLDTRKAEVCGDVNPLRINISKNRKTAAIAVGVQLARSQWNAVAEKVQSHPQAMLLNKMLAQKKVEVDGIILKLEDEGKLEIMTALEIRDYILSVTKVPEVEPETEVKPKTDPNTFLKWYDRFMNRKQGRTKGIYRDTRNRLVAWFGEEELDHLKFEDIKISWLEDFTDFLAETCSINTISIHLRNVRAVVNYAIDNEVTTYYAFRRFKIKTEVTKKRNYDIDTLRRIFNHKCNEEWQQKYLDFFKLSFMLIGINVKDLCYLKEVQDGRINYIRAKTHRPYSIKVEAEAQALIDRYAGQERLVCFAENYKNYRSYYMNMCTGFKEIKKQLCLEVFTSYWARHTWATLAVKLGISKDVVALALGHGQNTVTDIYIEYDMDEVDKANRKVLDYVLYGIDYREVPVEAPKKKRGRPRKVAAPQTDTAMAV